MGHRHPALLRQRQRRRGAGVQRGARAYRKVGDRTQEAWSLHQLGLSLLKLGDIDEARPLLADGPPPVQRGGRRRRGHARPRRPLGGGDGGRRPPAGGAAGGPRQADPGLLRHRPRRASSRRRSRRRRGRTWPACMEPAELARYEAEGAALPLGDGVRYALGEIALRSSTRVSRRDRALPEGIVTFLFTDIEGSTRLLTDIGDAAYGEALGAAPGTCRGAVAAEGGVVVRIRGRRASSSPSRRPPGPIRAAVAAQRALAAHAWEGGDVRVRMGIHTGEVAGRRGRLRGHRGPPGGARRGGRPRRPGHRHGCHARRRGRDRRRDRPARPRRAPAQGLRARRSGCTRSRRRPGDHVPGAPDARPDAQQPAAAAHHVRRAGRGRRRRGAAGPDAAADAHGPRRDGQDAAVAGRSRATASTGTPTAPGSCRSRR